MSVQVERSTSLVPSLTIKDKKGQHLIKHKEVYFNKMVRYTDKQWEYEANTEGVMIKLTCPCGKEHRLRLGPGMNIGVPEEIIDVEGDENDSESIPA
jgi:hypothetical protein